MHLKSFVWYVNIEKRKKKTFNVTNRKKNSFIMYGRNRLLSQNKNKTKKNSLLTQCTLRDRIKYSLLLECVNVLLHHLQEDTYVYYKLPNYNI